MSASLFQAIVRPQVAERVFLELAASGFVESLYAQEIQGSGSRSQGHTIKTADFGLLPKVQICGMVRREHYEQVIAAIRSTASMGRSGDGKIYVSSVMQEFS